MKIALVIFHADPARGGAERYTFDLASALSARGNDVSLLASSFGPRPDNVASVRIDARGLTRIGRYERFLDSLDRYLADSSYDVVHAMLPVRHCDVYHPHAGVAAEAVASGHLKYDCPVARAAARAGSVLNLKRRRFATIEKQLLSRTPGPVVICLSEYVRRTVAAHYPLPDAKLTTIYNGVDLKRFDPDARPETRGQVRAQLGLTTNAVAGLIIAQDFHRKGLRQAIEALARVGDPKLNLVVVGKENPGTYRSMAEKLGVADRVLFAGATSDPCAFYSAADFFILPTRHDPCSLVVLEALAMGLPVISTIHNGACELMQDGREGIVLRDPSDIDSLTTAMRQMLDATARARMRAACLQLRPALSNETHVDRVLEVYRNARNISPLGV